jgi:hypothetical protein
MGGACLEGVAVLPRYDHNKPEARAWMYEQTKSRPSVIACARGRRKGSRPESFAFPSSPG